MQANNNLQSADDSGSKDSASAPFFVIGCVRSGTTMLRDALRMHPDLACPEETHFFRWGDPYGTDQLIRPLTNNAVLKRHREIDGITEDEFKHILAAATSRAELYEAYMALYIQRKKPGATRWFDKTPQNVYGSLLAASSMPSAKFVHIVRDPVNVVASLRIGRIVKVENLVGACNYWNEAVQIVAGLKSAYPSRVYELKYEDFVRDPMRQLELLLNFLGSSFNQSWFAKLSTRQVDHSEEGILDDSDLATVLRLCAAGRAQYDHEDPTALRDRVAGAISTVPHKVAKGAKP